jgi:hypothetical protein
MQMLNTLKPPSGIAAGNLISGDKTISLDAIPSPLPAL